MVLNHAKHHKGLSGNHVGKDLTSFFKDYSKSNYSTLDQSNQPSMNSIALWQINCSCLMTHHMGVAAEFRAL